jgi:integrase
MKGSVIVYRGKRGDVFRIKYADAAGKQVMETVGSERDGWTKRKAEAELRDRLVKVDKGGWRRPAPRTFASVLPEWRREEGARKDWKPSTAAQYASIEKRLSAFFGPMRLAAIRPADVSRYLAEMLDDYAPAHVCRDLAILHSIFKWAKKKGYTDSNPAEDADRPKVRQRKGHDLSPAQVQLLLRSFDDEQARTVFLTFVLTGIRNAELRAMRWRDVDLIENRLAIPDSKTEDGVRVVSLSPLLAEELWQQALGLPRRRRAGVLSPRARQRVPHRDQVSARARAGLRVGGTPLAGEVPTLPRPAGDGDHDRRP